MNIYLTGIKNNKTRAVMALKRIGFINNTSTIEIVNNLPKIISVANYEDIKTEFEFIDLEPYMNTYYVEINKNCVCPVCNKPRFDCNCEEKKHNCYVCYSIKDVISAIENYIKKGYDERYIEIKTTFNNSWGPGFAGIPNE